MNTPGSPTNPNGTDGAYIDNNETPGEKHFPRLDTDGATDLFRLSRGCETGAHGPYSCYPLTWKTTFEVYESLNVSWQVWQDTDNFDDNPLAWFKQYQTAPNGSALHDHGNSFSFTLDDFYAAAAAGTLPQVSFIVGPTELSEHPPWQPKDGAWLHQQVFNAVTKSPKYNSTVLLISYDGMVPPDHSDYDG
jgi:phospholipase C